MAVAKVNDYDPSSVDLPALIECRSDVPTSNSFALWLSDQPNAPAKLGWKEARAGNLFLKQYELPAPLGVFGRETASIVFTTSGPMAMFEDVSAADLAQALGVTAPISTPEKFLGEKVVIESSEQADRMTFATRIALNISTVESHPGKTLAGCSYALDVK